MMSLAEITEQSWVKYIKGDQVRKINYGLGAKYLLAEFRKTLGVNLPEDVTKDDDEQLILSAWDLHIKGTDLNREGFFQACDYILLNIQFDGTAKIIAKKKTYEDKKNCLKCEKPFKSKSNINRMCSNCKHILRDFF
jgi:hypothetical protein